LMALTTNPKVWKILGVIAFLLTGLIITLFYFEEIFVTFLIGVVLIFITNKSMHVYDIFCDMIYFNKYVKKILGYVLFVGLLYAFYLFSYYSILGLNEAFISSQSITLSNYYTQVSKYLPKFLGEGLINLDTLGSIQSLIFGKLSQFASNIPSYFMNAILIIPLIFYVYYKKRKLIIENVIDAVPSKFHSASKRAFDKISYQLKDFTNAKFYESLIIFIICLLGFYLANIPGWLFLALLAGVLNIIPYVGPFIGAIPPLLIGLMLSPIQALYVLITVGVAQTIDNIYIIPFFISNSVKIDPLLSIVLILVGAKLFGPVGMILAIPIYLIYKIVLEETYVELVNVYENKKYRYSYGHKKEEWE
ncbi:AI-2E family transporter, partial [Candidatus Woesearchaeota archaeon]|nr:AI-2E family transporter [Candidatus Woesearchaeota archaeon]